MASKTPDLSCDKSTTRIYYASKIPEIDIAALAYFPASIFWRGAIHPWNDDGTIPVQLGPFQESFRQYLMGLRSFPNDCCLLVAVREGKQASYLMHPPTGERKGRFHVYNFPMPGFAFTLVVSKNIPAELSRKCFVRGPGNPVVVTSILESGLFDEAAKLWRLSRG